MTTPTRSIAGGFALMWFGLLVAGSLLALIAPLSGSEPGAGWPSDWFWVPVFGLGVSLVTSLALLIGAALAYRRPWPGRWPILLPLAPLHALSFLAMWGMGRPLAPVAVYAAAIGAVSVGLLGRMRLDLSAPVRRPTP